MVWTVEEMPDLSGKTAVVTGGNAGLGYEFCLQLLKKNAHVIMASRSEEKANTAIEALKQATGKESIEFIHLDLASFASIRKFAETYIAKGYPINILINNAGIANVPHSKTEDGFEITIGVNGLGTMLLTCLLLDVLKKSAPARVVTITSNGADTIKKLDWDDLGGKTMTTSSMMTAYSISKLYNLMFGLELERRLSGTGVHSFLSQPGNSATEITSKMSNDFSGWIFYLLSKLMAQSIAEGALSTLYAATATELEGQGGQCFGPNMLNRGNTNSWLCASPFASDADAQKRLYDELEEIIGIAK